MPLAGIGSLAAVAVVIAIVIVVVVAVVIAVVGAGVPLVSVGVAVGVVRTLAGESERRLPIIIAVLIVAVLIVAVRVIAVVAVVRPVAVAAVEVARLVAERDRLPLLARIVALAVRREHGAGLIHRAAVLEVADHR